MFDGGGDIRGVLARPLDAESQYFRRMIARTIGAPGWDWRQGMNHHFMLLLMEAAKSGLQGAQGC